MLARKIFIGFVILYAFFTFVNHSDKLAIFNLYWFDHDIKNTRRPACFATAEVKPGAEWCGQRDYNGEYFGIQMNDRDGLHYREIVNTHKGDHRIRVIWDGEKIIPVEAQETSR